LEEMRPMRLRFTSDATAHIASIYEFLADRNPVAARRSSEAFAQRPIVCANFPILVMSAMSPEPASG